MKRRDFLSRTLSVVPWAAAASLVWPAGRFLLFGEAERGKITLPLAQIGEGITPLPAAALFVRREGDSITIFDAHCTHMGCLLHYDGEHRVFDCPCHGSRFDRDGKRLRGPAKRDLDTVSFTLSATALVIG
jgi:cytochrome b6-f complex iron-sulfur subunit